RARRAHQRHRRDRRGAEDADAERTRFHASFLSPAGPRGQSESCMDARFHGKVTLVTGAASGIGAACARRFAAEGARLPLCDLDHAGLEALAKSIDPSGERVLTARVDVASLDEVQSFTDAAAARFGRLDVVMNNAGIGALGRSDEMDPAVWHRTFAVDVDSIF